MIVIDGGKGEGGGQVLRSALALAMALRQPFRMHAIRGKRPRPGLKRQHLTCVLAAQKICRAKVTGAHINSTELCFEPGEVKPGHYKFDIGSGGSCTLVLQALLPPLLLAAGPSSITVTGGTHVPAAPPFEFLELTLLPWLEKLGPKIKPSMEQPGFMQVGGGSIKLEITPCAQLRPLLATKPSAFVGTSAHIMLNDLDESIASREESTLQKMNCEELGLSEDIACFAEKYALRNKPIGPGNVVMLVVRHQDYVTVCSTVGKRNLGAEKVAGRAVNRALDFIRADVPVCRQLADQLLVPLALTGGGSFLTEYPSRHTNTCIELIRQFMDIKVDITRQGEGRHLLSMERN